MAQNDSGAIAPPRFSQSLEIMETEDKGEHVKTVYAHFGLAMYMAQVLEHGLANALMIVELLPRRAGKPIPRSEWKVEFDEFMEKKFELTLGRLIRGLDAATSVPSDFEAELTKALNTRNFLAHHFFRERAETFMSSSGREKMIQELEEARDLFSMADDKLTELIKPIQEKYGLTGELIKVYEEEYFKKFDNDL